MRTQFPRDGSDGEDVVPPSTQHLPSGIIIALVVTTSLGYIFITVRLKSSRVNSRYAVHLPKLLAVGRPVQVMKVYQELLHPRPADLNATLQVIKLLPSRINCPVLLYCVPSSYQISWPWTDPYNSRRVRVRPPHIEYPSVFKAPFSPPDASRNGPYLLGLKVH